MAREHALPDLLRLVVDRLAESPRVALARIWLVQRSEDCDGCLMPAECRDRSACLHLVASAGRSAVDPKVEWTRLDGALPPLPAGGAEGRADRGHRRADRGARPAARPARLGRRPGLDAGRGHGRVRRPAAGPPRRGARGAGRLRPRGGRAGLHGLAADHRRPRRRRHRHRPGVRADRGAHAAAGAGERVPARGGDAGRRLRRAGRPRPGPGGGRPADRPGGPDRRGRPHPRRERHGQGAGRPRGAPAEQAGRHGR